jgi:hypothetical protein
MGKGLLRGYPGFSPWRTAQRTRSGRQERGPYEIPCDRENQKPDAGMPHTR